MKNLIVLFIIICFNVCSCLSRQLHGSLSTYTTLDGLANNAIMDIYTDSQGFVWICTWNGISRFDGYSFKNYGDKPGSLAISQSRFMKVQEDRSLNLWFWTYDDHIYRLNHKNDRFDPIDSLVAQLSSHPGKVGNICICSHSSDVWAEYKGLGLICFHNDNDNNLSIHSFIGQDDIGADINSICETDSGAIWCVSMGTNISLIENDHVKLIACENDHIKRVTVSGEFLYTISDNSVSAYDRSGCLWRLPISGTNLLSIASSKVEKSLFIGTSNKGVIQVSNDGEIKQNLRENGTVTQDIREIFVDSRNILWLTNGEPGITRYLPKENDYKHFCQKLYTVDYYVDTTSVVKEKGQLTFVKMRQGGFGLYDAKTDEVMPFFDDPADTNRKMTNGIVAFDVSDDDVIWASPFYERGLFEFELDNDNSVMKKIMSDEGMVFFDDIRAIMVDGNGNIWAGAKNGKLFCYSKDYTLIFSTSMLNGEEIGRIYTIYEDSLKNIWIGTKGNGLWKVACSRRSNKLRIDSSVHYTHNPNNMSSLSSDQIYSITEDEEHHIWIATYDEGLNMLEDSNSCEFININNTLLNYPSKEIPKGRYLTCYNKDLMLEATSEGILTFNPRVSPSKMVFDYSLKNLNSQTFASNNDIVQILLDKSKNIWLATLGNGLIKIENINGPKGVIYRSYTNKEGLPSNMVLSLSEDKEGFIWAATELGLVKINPANESFTYMPQLTGYSLANFNEAASAIDTNGKILLGSKNSLYYFSPEEVTVSHQNMQLAFTDTCCNVLILPYDYSTLSFQFASLNFKLQKHVKYMYKLEGYDDDWVKCGNVHSINYTKVPHGEYIFKVRAYIENDAIYSEEIERKVKIETPPWLRWYAFVLYSLVIAGIIVIILRTVYIFARLRTGAKYEKQVLEARSMAFANISHELRTPLTLITGGLEELKNEKDLSDSARRSVDLSFGNAKRMLALVNRLLDVRNIIHNEIKLQISQNDIVALVGMVYNEFKDLSIKQNLSFFMNTPFDSYLLWYDKTRLESVLYNVISNAFKFTPENGCVEISLSKNDNRKTFSISVCDTGVGISSKNLKYLFNRYSHFTESLHGTVSGTGIGLSLSKQIVELHHGHLIVNSEENKGTTIIIELPIDTQAYDKEQTDWASPEATALISYNESTIEDVKIEVTKQNLLLADDNAEIRNFISRHLSNMYNVISAIDGEDAYEKISQLQIDIALIDICMPKMDGLTLVKKIRENFTTSHVPIIIMTANDSIPNQLKSMQYGADLYMAKPFSLEVLKASVDNLARKQNSIKAKIVNEETDESFSEEALPEIILTAKDKSFLESLSLWIDENLTNNDVSINEMAKHFCLGRTTFYNKVKTLTGQSPVELVKEKRIRKSKELLDNSDMTISEVAYQMGYSDSSYFTRCFKDQYKITPTDYLKKKRHN